MQWCDLSDDEINKNKVKLTFKYDMGCYKRSSGRIYDYYISHTFIKSGIYKGVIGMVLYSKDFQMLDAGDRR